LPVFYAEINPMELTTAELAGAATAETSVATLLERFRAECGRGEGEHLERVQRLLQAEIEAATKPRRRRPAWQHPKRHIQQEIRQGTVGCSHELRQRGYTLDEVAELLNLTPRTLRQWEYTCRPEKLAVAPLGRPTARSPVGTRQE